MVYLSLLGKPVKTYIDDVDLEGAIHSLFHLGMMFFLPPNMIRISPAASKPPASATKTLS